MSDLIYTGPSEGFSEVVDGYEDYAKSVLIERAVPDVRDGLKPVQRRCLYACFVNKTEYRVKCSTLVGYVMQYHPHGDQSIYGTLALMTDENGSCNIPFFDAEGNMGKVYLSDPPAAMRYPTAKINKNTLDLFRDKEVMTMIPAEEGDGTEPEVLVAPYPVVLVNGANGIAVSAGTKMPSFNFGDVVDLTVKYIQSGLNITDIIKPDFPTGGVLVSNDEELAKIMTTGKGKLKVRAKVEIVGKEIHVMEVPIGKTVQSIVRNINAAEIKDISSATEATGRDTNCLVRITCKTKRCVEQVLMELYRRNILQNVFSSSILVVDTGKPVITGVHGVIERWYKFRVSKLKEKFQLQLDAVSSERKLLSYLIRLCSNIEYRDKYIDIMVNQNDQSAMDYLKELFPDIPHDTGKWILARSLGSLRKASKYTAKDENLAREQEGIQYNMSHVDEYIVNELLELKRSKQGTFERKTEITYTDYKFSKVSDSDEIEDTSFCVYTLLKNGFLVKDRSVYENREDVLCEIYGNASSVLIGFDNFGRVLRIFGKEIPFTAYGNNGVYLPKFFEATFQEDYKVLYLGLLDGKNRMLVYRDGYVGFFDTNEFYGKKNIRVTGKGVCTAVYDKLLHVYEEDEIPEYVVLADDTQDKIRLGIVPTADIPARTRLSRAKVLTGSNIDTHYLNGYTEEELVDYITNPDDYVGKLKVFRGEFLGNPEELEDGRYLGICNDIEVN